MLVAKSIWDVLLTEDVKDQWQQKMVYYWEKKCTHNLPAKYKLRFGHYTENQKIWLCRQSETYTLK